MPIIQHKFSNHQISSDTKILILGTFNPDVPNGPDFFYGRPRNYLWQLLPVCWDEPTLKNKSLLDKKKFMNRFKIDFADLIHQVDVENDQVNNVNDRYLDNRVTEWKNIVELLDMQPSISEVYFTRKTFGGIPNMRQQVQKIQGYCADQKIRFCFLNTPARFANGDKQQYWKNTIIEKNTCINL